MSSQFIVDSRTVTKRLKVGGANRIFLISIFKMRYFVIFVMLFKKV